MPTRSKWCLLGAPDHQGVANVGGRIGAALGPAAFRRALGAFKGADGVLEALTDLGDAGPFTSDVAANHRQAADRIAEAHRWTGLSVVVGGGHDHGYSHLAGVLRALQENRPRARLGCLNIDAHLDLRKPEPAITSGSPFYLAIEAGVLDPRRFVEFGIQPQCNAAALWEYARAKKIKVVAIDKARGAQAVPAFRRALGALKASCDAVVVSLDLDAAAQAFAPGVSAPQAEGFAPGEIFGMMEAAGADRKVASLGVFELNPVHDAGEMTARLAATAAYRFVAAALKR